MGETKGTAADRWDNVYVSFLNEAHKHSVSDLGGELVTLAEKCYKMLFVCTEIENRVNPDS